MNAQRIGEKLKALRSNQTLKEVSGILGISDSALNAYELGLRVPLHRQEKAKDQAKKIPEVKTDSQK